MRRYYVYLFYDKDRNVIYVGKTKRALKRRMREHFGPRGHLSKSLLKKVRCIKYYEFSARYKMDLAEAYLIKKYKKTCQNKRKEKIDADEEEFIRKEVVGKNLKVYADEVRYEEHLVRRIKAKIKKVFSKLKNLI